MTKKQTKRPPNLTTREVLALSLTDSMNRRAAAQRKLIESKALLAKRIDNAVRDETKGGETFMKFEALYHVNNKYKREIYYNPSLDKALIYTTEGEACLMMDLQESDLENLAHQMSCGSYSLLAPDSGLDFAAYQTNELRPILESYDKAVVDMRNTNVAAYNSLVAKLKQLMFAGFQVEIKYGWVSDEDGNKYTLVTASRTSPYIYVHNTGGRGVAVKQGAGIFEQLFENLRDTPVKLIPRKGDIDLF
jgi:hypothetical protein